mmetsp:Transcript_19659/g.45823  ORF Transcript_19659/g.45823 Transcript_19659/m.45823 type:complete len:259 (+) Transcript_19659:114-890(+)
MRTRGNKIFCTGMGLLISLSQSVPVASGACTHTLLSQSAIFLIVSMYLLNQQSTPLATADGDELNGNCQTSCVLVHFLQPIHTKVLHSMNNLGGEVVRQRTLALLPDSEVEGYVLSSLSLELQGAMKRPQLAHGRQGAALSASTAASIGTFQDLASVGRQHEAEVVQTADVEARRDKMSVHRCLELRAKVVNLPLNSCAHAAVTQEEWRGEDALSHHCAIIGDSGANPVWHDVVWHVVVLLVEIHHLIFSIGQHKRCQ